MVSDCDMNNILTALHSATGVNREALCSLERQRNILYARYIAIHLLHEQGCTMEAIGHTLNRTRQGVSKALRLHQILNENDYLYRNTYTLVKALLSVPPNTQLQFAFVFMQN